MKKLSLEEKALALCEDARAQLILRHPFVGRLGIQIPFIAVNDSRIHTIATNGKVIYIRPDWICAKPPATLAAVVAHTIWTAALCHSFRRKEYDLKRFDIASDIEVYNLLKVEKVTMARKPDFADLFPQYQPVEKILEKLPDVSCQRSFDADVHLYSAGVVSLPPLPLEEEKKQEEEKEEEEKSSCENGNTQDSNQENSKETPDYDGTGRSNSCGKTQNDGGTRSAEGHKDGNDNGNDDTQEADCSCDPAIREVWRQRIIEAGQHYRMTYGSLPGELEMLVESFRESKINYLQLLRRFLGQCSGGESHWLPPARRFIWQGQYLPSRTNPALEFVVAVDTSGSIDQEIFQKFLGEVYGIIRQLKKYQLTLIQCDSRIQHVEQFSPEKPLLKVENIKLYGGGGTSFKPVFKYIENEKIRPKVLLYYTDGMGTFPDKAPDYPVLWFLSEETKVPWGKKILIPSEECQ
jgi:predicted metal-dependent peptidase